jgi:hypothetical protein
MDDKARGTEARASGLLGLLGRGSQAQSARTMGGSPDAWVSSQHVPPPRN